MNTATISPAQPNTPPKQIQTELNKQPTVPQSLGEYYTREWKTQFNKLSKNDQDALTVNLTKAARIVRGEVVECPDVKKFVKSIIEKAEESYEKSKKAATPV